MASQKRKVTLYFNASMLAETQREGVRQDRSISWIIQAAWRTARDQMRKIPSAVVAGSGAQASSVQSAVAAGVPGHLGTRPDA